MGVVVAISPPGHHAASESDWLVCADVRRRHDEHFRPGAAVVRAYVHVDVNVLH